MSDSLIHPSWHGTDAWWVRLPEIVLQQRSWIFQNAGSSRDMLANQAGRESATWFLATIKRAGEIVDLITIGYAPVACLGLRPILEQLTLLEAAVFYGIDFVELCSSLKSDNQRTRRQATQNTLELVFSRNSDAKALYEILSRWFSHTTVDEAVPPAASSHNFVGAWGAYLHPNGSLLPRYACFYFATLYVLDRIVDLVRVLGELPPPILPWRHSVPAPTCRAYADIATTLLLGSHTKNNPLKIGIFIKDLRTSVGLTHIILLKAWRRGARIVCSNPHLSPSELLEIVATFILGRDYLIWQPNLYKRGKEWEISWKGHAPISWVTVTILAGGRLEPAQKSIIDFIEPIRDYLTSQEEHV